MQVSKLRLEEGIDPSQTFRARRYFPLLFSEGNL